MKTITTSIVFGLSLSLSFTALAQAQSVYQCTTAKGKTSFQQTPCDENSTEQKKDLNSQSNFIYNDHAQNTTNAYQSMKADAVLADRYGIGFVSMAAVGNKKLLAVYEGTAQALKPNHLTVATEDYVLSRRLFMYAAADKPEVHNFMSYMQSDAGQQIVAETGYISQKIEAVVPADYQSLPRGYQRLTEGAQRLTVNFRFLDDKVELDNKGVKDIQRLVDYLQDSPTQKLLLIGFVDPKSTDAKSQRLSTLRTRLVNSKLMRLGIHNAEVVGLGDDLLVAATDEFNGRLKNRRVEVWVRP